MLESGCVTPGSMSEQIAQSREYFANGKIAMTWDGPFISTISKQVNPKIRVAFAPAWKDVTGGYLWAGSGLALAANSVHKAEGWKFLEYLLSEDVSTMMTNKVSIPFSTKAGFKLLETSDDPILKEIPAMLNQDPKANFFFGPLPDFNSLSQTLQEQFNLAVAGKKDAKVALDEAAVAWNKAIDAAK
jgi:ABC-type glycerol-3-phosphate transport system substrate-binding protein